MDRLRFKANAKPRDLFIYQGNKRAIKGHIVIWTGRIEDTNPIIKLLKPSGTPYDKIEWTCSPRYLEFHSSPSPRWRV